MGSVKESLDRLREEANRVSKIKLKGSNTQVVDSLIARKRSRIIRDGDQHEQQLVRFCMNDSNIIQKLKSDLHLNPINPRKEDTERVLNTAKSFNQICNSANLKERIEILEQNYDERQINLNYLEDTRSKNESDIDRLTRSNTEQNTMNIDENSDNSGDDVRDEELALKRFEQELSQRRQRAKNQSMRKSENLHIHQQLTNLSAQQHAKLKQGASDTKTVEKIGNLEQDIRAKRRRLIEYDTMLEDIIKTSTSNSKSLGGIKEHHKQATTREVYTGLRARIEKLLKGAPSDNDDTSSNVIELVSTFQSIETQVRDILDRLESAEKSKEMNEMSRYIYHKLSTWIYHRVMRTNQEEQVVDMDQFNTAFPHNKHTIVPEYTFPKETLLSTAILLKLYDQQGDIPLASLDDYVCQVAKEHNVSEETSSQAIYTLAASQLVSIDRSHKDSLVKLNLTSSLL